MIFGINQVHVKNAGPVAQALVMNSQRPHSF